MHSSAARSYPYLAITWGSRGAAVYKAVQIDAKNPYVAQTLENGVQDATLLHERTPSKALRWLRDYSNQFHMGSSSSFIDKMQECVTIQDDWGVAKKDNGWTSRLLGGTQEYDKKFRSWFEETNSEFGEWELFSNTKSLTNTLVRFDLLDSVGDFCAEYVDFLRSGFETGKALIVLHEASTMMKMNFSSAMPRNHFQCAIFELFKFALPLWDKESAADSDVVALSASIDKDKVAKEAPVCMAIARQVPWLLKDTGPSLTSTLSVLMYPMTNGKAHEKLRASQQKHKDLLAELAPTADGEAQQQDPQDVAADATTPVAKKRGRAAGAAGAPKKKSRVVSAKALAKQINDAATAPESVPVEVSVGDVSRQVRSMRSSTRGHQLGHSRSQQHYSALWSTHGFQDSHSECKCGPHTVFRIHILKHMCVVLISS